MSALATTNETQHPTSNAVTAISSVARVDYILRFSKHAVLVIDDEVNNYSSVGSQYLANLSTNYNAAYLSMSPRLDDLQVRCRLIEQLFGQVLFDPEQSVAVSLVNLIKQNQQPVSIVVENAHHLSFQLLHELCQLAEIGKKANLAIQVVLLALPIVGQKLVEHTALFNKKLSIVDALSGQLIPLSDKRFYPTGRWQDLTPLKKVFYGIALLAAVGIFVVYQLYQRDSLAFSQLTTIGDNSVVSEKVPANIQENIQEDVKIHGVEEQKLNQLTTDKTTAVVKVSDYVQATPQEISAALMDINTYDSSILSDEMIRASAGDIAAVLSIDNQKQNETVAPTLKTTKAPSIAGEIENDALVVESSKNNQNELATPLSFYHDKTGFVLQFAVVSQSKTVDEFIELFSSIEINQYHRLSGEEVMIVLTSKIFETRDQALAWLTHAPVALQKREPFVRSIQSIKDEIDVYQRSQS